MILSTDLKLGKEVDQQLKREITENVNLFQKNYLLLVFLENLAN